MKVEKLVEHRIEKHLDLVEDVSEKEVQVVNNIDSSEIECNTKLLII